MGAKLCVCPGITGIPGNALVAEKAGVSCKPVCWNWRVRHSGARGSCLHAPTKPRAHGKAGAVLALLQGHRRGRTAFPQGKQSNKETAENSPCSGTKAISSNVAFLAVSR